MKKILPILAYIWQLPQHLLGLLLVAVLRPENKFDFGDPPHQVLLHYSSRIRGGISLGKYVIVSLAYSDYTGRTENHERGHSIQSLYLGPLYLIVVGLPSILWAAWWNEDRNRSYHSFWTEAWADRLGGVERC